MQCGASRVSEGLHWDQENGGVILRNLRKERMQSSWRDRKGEILPSRTEVEEPAGNT